MDTTRNTEAAILAATTAKTVITILLARSAIMAFTCNLIDLVKTNARLATTLSMDLAKDALLTAKNATIIHALDAQKASS